MYCYISHLVYINTDQYCPLQSMISETETMVNISTYTIITLRELNKISPFVSILSSYHILCNALYNLHALIIIFIYIYYI